MSDRKVKVTRLEPVYVKPGQAVIWPAQPLTQEELDGHHRNDWVRKVLALIEEKRHIKFLVHKNHYSVAEFDDKWGSGCEWNFSVGDQHFYSYRLGDLIHCLEAIWDSGAEVLTLKGEVDIPVIHRVKSNAPEEKES